MIKKEFSHKKIEVCGLCEKEINTKKDNWASVIDLQGNIIMGVKFYHRNCLTDLIKGQGKIIEQRFENKLKQMTGSMFNIVKPMLDKMNSGSQNKNVVYDIKNG